MADFARRERSGLADLLLRVGPDHPTMCTGWSTRDLAAHLVVRDRRPDAALGALVPALGGHGEHVRKQKAAEPYERVVDEVRNPPWWSPVSNPVTSEAFNGLEYFIHTEDVRRAAPEWSPRELPPADQAALWTTVRRMAPLTLRRRNLVLKAPGLGEVRVGKETPTATLIGAPGELALFVSGRQRVSRVEIEAPAETAEKLRNAKFRM